jgi:large conductance mechanosensitive channel
MLKGFKEFIARGNIIDLSVAVVIGTAFTALVTAFTQNVVQPLIDRIGAGPDREYGILRIPLGGDQFVDLNAVLSAAINFVLVAAVVYFVIVLPYKKLRERGEVEQAQDTELSILTEIRDLLHAQATDASTAPGKHVTGPGTGPSPDTARHTSADKD